MSRAHVAVFAVLLAGSGEVVSVGSAAPTYTADVAPILAAQCVGCHSATDPLPLHDYAAVSARRLDVLDAMESGRMPPWGAPDPRCAPLITPPTPTGADVLKMRAWVVAGAPQGTPREPPVVTPSRELTVRSDLRSTSPAFSPPTTRVHTQCFLLDATADEHTQITAARLTTDHPEAILWAELRDTVLGEGALAAVLAEDPDPGWYCPFPDAYRTPNTLVLWPGHELVVRHPAGTGTRVEAGRRLVLRVRYDTSEPIVDSPGIELELDPSAQPARIVTHEPVNGSMLSVQGGLAEARFDAAVLQTSTMPRTVRAIAPGLSGRRSGRDRLGRLGDTDRCFVDVARGARRGWYTVAEPFRIESTELLEVSCTYDTRADTRDVAIGSLDGHAFCGAHLYVTAWMPSDE